MRETQMLRAHKKQLLRSKHHRAEARETCRKQFRTQWPA